MIYFAFLFFHTDLQNTVEPATMNGINGGGGGEKLPEIVTIPKPAPPAISVVTFRWDSINLDEGKPDR